MIRTPMNQTYNVKVTVLPEDSQPPCAIDLIEQSCTDHTIMLAEDAGTKEVAWQE